MYFKDYTLCHRVPYVVYADFESFVVPIVNTSVNVAHHVPASFYYVIVDWTGKAVAEPVLYCGKDVVDTFLRMILDNVARLDRNFQEPMRMTVDDERAFETCTLCHLSKKAMTEENKIRNHCHMTGKYLGAGHE